MIRRRSVAQQPKDVFKGYSTSTAHDIVMIFTLFDNLMVRIECKIRRARATIGNQRLLFGRGDPSGFLLNTGSRLLGSLRESEIYVLAILYARVCRPGLHMQDARPYSMLIPPTQRKIIFLRLSATIPRTRRRGVPLTCPEPRRPLLTSAGPRVVPARPSVLPA